MILVCAAYIGLTVACAVLEFVRRGRRIDQAALAALLLLATVTRPGLEGHKIAVARAVMSGAHTPGVMQGSSANLAHASRLTAHLGFHDFIVISVTTCTGRALSVGLFGGVFVGDATDIKRWQC